VALEETAAATLATAGSTRWVGFSVYEEQVETFSQENRRRPGGETRYRKNVKSVFRLDASVNAGPTSYDAATDGCFPLITNADDLAPAEVLKSYRYQPNLERRNHVLKGPQLVAPVFIEHPNRIEAILLCHFIAMLTGARIEREIRNSMKARGLKSIPLYPESRDCPSPSTPRILEIFERRAGGEGLRPRTQPVIPPGTGTPARSCQRLRLAENHLKWGNTSHSRSAERQHQRLL
jgi:hypothetical protein